MWMPDEIYPITVVLDRYGGTYSGGIWTAWNLETDEIPPEVGSDDVTCFDFWQDADKKFAVGRGCTPDEAVANLHFVVEDMDQLGEEVPNIETESMRSEDKGVSPALCNAGNNAVHHHYFGCPKCGSEVSGFVITGDGEADWSIHKDRFCHECGQKIDWDDTEWSSIYCSR